MVTTSNGLRNGQQVVPEAPDADVLDEFMGAMEELTGQSLAALQRDSSIPEGTLLAESELPGGGALRFKKQSTGVSANGQPLPERIAVYRRTDNDISMVPTAQLMYQLAKKDGTGKRIYSRRPWPDAVAPTYIYKDVPLLGGGVMHRKFPSEAAYEAFMQAKHTDIWNSMRREEELRRHNEEISEQRNLAAAILLAVTGGQTPAVGPALEHLNREGLLALADERHITLSERQRIEVIREEIRAALEAVTA